MTSFLNMESFGFNKFKIESCDKNNKSQNNNKFNLENFGKGKQSHNKHKKNNKFNFGSCDKNDKPHNQNQHKKNSKFNLESFGKDNQHHNKHNKKRNDKKKHKDAPQKDGSRFLMMYMLFSICFGMVVSNQYSNNIEEDSCLESVCSAEYNFTPTLKSINYRNIESNYPMEQIQLI